MGLLAVWPNREIHIRLISLWRPEEKRPSSRHPLGSRPFWHAWLHGDSATRLAQRGVGAISRPSMPRNSSPVDPFDPLAVENVGVTLAIELMEQPLHSVPPQTRFGGAGVYALYYGGDLEAYAPLVALDKAEGGWWIPIYVGRALRENARKGFTTRPVTEDSLHERIKKHARSIAQTENLNLADFRCRFLVLNDAYISLAESVMIATFRPLWNGMGLGSNQTGGPRMAGQASQWDSLHPGRKGRPAGTPESRALAAEAVTNIIASLGDPRDDPRTEAMIEKIRRRGPGNPLSG